MSRVGPLAFGGGQLAEFSAMRVAYLDEAGISNETHAVVAGVIIEPDKHYHRLARSLAAVIDSIPDELHIEGLILHATDIWHGSRHFDRQRWADEGWDKERRRELLKWLCKIPAILDLPVVIGAAEKAYNDPSKFGPHWGDNLTLNRACYSLAFAQACLEVENAILRIAPDETAMVIAEDNREMRADAKRAYWLLKEDTAWSDDFGGILPLTRVFGVPNFAAKTEDSVLQVADAIAFIACRSFGGCQEAQSYFELFNDQIIQF